MATPTLRDAQQAFRDAIQQDLLPGGPDDWMYMHSEGIQDVFKNRNTREYLTTNYVEGF